MGKARKGGGIFLRPVMSSSSGMFARKGDPWVTDREGREQFNRQVEVENPDMDADRQRHARIKGFSKEFQDRVKRVDVKMTMREAVETERSTRLDGYQARKTSAYQAEKAPLRRPEKGKWPKPGKDFEVATVQRRCVNVALKLKNDLRAMRVEVKSSEKRNEPVPPDNIPAVVSEGSKKLSREKQTPRDLRGHEGFYDFSGKSPPKEIKKNGKIFRRK